MVMIKLHTPDDSRAFLHSMPIVPRVNECVRIRGKLWRVVTIEYQYLPESVEVDVYLTDGPKEKE